VSYAVFTIGSKRLLDAGRPSEAVMAWSFTAGALLLAPILVLGDMSWLRQPSGIAMAVWLSAVPTAFAYLLFAAGLRNLPAREVATLTLMEPVTATALAFVVLGERPGAAAVVGIALVFIGLAIMARGSPAPLPVVEPRC
jgi:drug/metabolite transporter, DME family